MPSKIFNSSSGNTVDLVPNVEGQSIRIKHGWVSSDEESEVVFLDQDANEISPRIYIPEYGTTKITGPLEYVYFPRSKSLRIKIIDGNSVSGMIYWEYFNSES